MLTGKTGNKIDCKKDMARLFTLMIV